MIVKLVLEFLVVIGALFMAGRSGGVALDLRALGFLVAVAGCGVPPGAISGAHNQNDTLNQGFGGADATKGSGR